MGIEKILTQAQGKMTDIESGVAIASEEIKKGNL